MDIHWFKLQKQIAARATFAPFAVPDRVGLPSWRYDTANGSHRLYAVSTSRTTRAFLPGIEDRRSRTTLPGRGF